MADQGSSGSVQIRQENVANLEPELGEPEQLRDGQRQEEQELEVDIRHTEQDPVDLQDDQEVMELVDAIEEPVTDRDGEGVSEPQDVEQQSKKRSNPFVDDTESGDEEFDEMICDVTSFLQVYTTNSTDIKGNIYKKYNLQAEFPLYQLQLCRKDVFYI